MAKKEVTVEEKLRALYDLQLIDSRIDEIRKIISSIDVNTYLLDSQSLRLGILIGRLYNSFYYQHRRILDRNPTTDEFLEFLDFIKLNQKNFQEKLGF